MIKSENICSSANILSLNSCSRAAFQLSCAFCHLFTPRRSQRTRDFFFGAASSSSLSSSAAAGFGALALISAADSLFRDFFYSRPRLPALETNFSGERMITIVQIGRSRFFSATLPNSNIRVRCRLLRGFLGGCVLRLSFLLFCSEICP